MLQLLVELPPGAYAPGGPNAAGMCVLQAPAISQQLSLWSRGEQLGVEELIPEPPVERFGKAVLPRRSRLDIRRAGCVAGIAPVPQGLGDELRAVVTTDVRAASQQVV